MGGAGYGFASADIGINALSCSPGLYFFEPTQLTGTAASAWLLGNSRRDRSVDRPSNPGTLARGQQATIRFVTIEVSLDRPLSRLCGGKGQGESQEERNS